tara:strand:- start:2820 stop:3965 length:1146 start_codon:yes stop_codon:yes gene_type:complete
MKKKVAIIDSLGAHGSSHHFYLFGQIRGLVDNEVRVALYTNSITPNPNIKSVDFYQFFGNLFSSKFLLIRGVKYIFGLLASIFHARFSGCNIFHFHLFESNFVVLLKIMLVKLLFAKVVLTIHDVVSFANTKNNIFLNNQIYKFADLILTHNLFSSKEILKISPLVTEKIFIIPHGNYIPFITVDNDQEKARDYLDIDRSKKVLLFFGMIKKVKGLDLLLNAFSRIIKRHSDIVLLIAGKSWKNDFSYYKKIIDKYNLSQHIILHNNFIPHNDVKYYYSAADLVVLPYKKIYQSGVLMMTLSYQKPALVSDLDPLNEIIKDGINGFVFKSEDHDSLFNKLDNIFSEKYDMKQINLNANLKIKNEFDWTNIGRLTKKAYQSL